jgi:hypothetical protein
MAKISALSLFFRLPEMIIESQGEDVCLVADVEIATLGSVMNKMRLLFCCYAIKDFGVNLTLWA